MRHDHGSSLGSKLRDGLEAQSAGHGGDIGEGLEDIGIAGVLTVIEQDDRSQETVTRNQSRHNVSLGVGDVGSIGSRSLHFVRATFSFLEV